jgi:hypothetical protein
MHTTAGKAATATTWVAVNADLKAGLPLFEDAPKPPTQKKARRPGLVNDDDDLDAMDGYEEEEEEEDE